MSSQAPGLMVIVGPTAAGKSAHALDLCEAVGGEIISADSVQVYRGLDVGSAKPTTEERARVVHHGIDLVDISETMDAARWIRAAESAIDDCHRRGSLPVVCGGTGMYVRGLVWGMAEIPEIPSAVRLGVREEIAEEGAETLHGQLALVDPEAASRIGARDAQRIGRALEVYRATGRSLSAWQQEGRERPPRWRAEIAGLWPEREALYQRIDQRVGRMFRDGWTEEVEALLSGGASPQAPGLQTLGYRDVVAAVQGGDVAAADLATRIATGHRNYARRQLTWFRRMEREGNL
ncbi:MAG: tRNA (adenosine(37)-N6)-dimethylallyltransferase MiaA, partial [Myxococcota bacterium]|nr:tRNA (adenosine(37)-N6)-dimethylallyltransferase MiaA [Myxococcota bacterium]